MDMLEITDGLKTDISKFISIPAVLEFSNFVNELIIYRNKHFIN